jgi:hypothetical protein
MGTFGLAHEFASLAAADIMANLRPALADADINDAVRMIRECCAAAIISAFIQQRWESPEGKEASERSLPGTA